VPGAGTLGFLENWRTTGRFIPGDGGEPFHLAPGVSLAPSICFEALRSGMFNADVRKGAGALVNLSDDGWFAGTAEPQQHLQSAAMRAVETRRWLLRASDSGISAVIDPTGRVVRQLDLGAIGTLEADVPLERTDSLYVRWGDWMIPVCGPMPCGIAFEKRFEYEVRTSDVTAEGSHGGNGLHATHLVAIDRPRLVGVEHLRLPSQWAERQHKPREGDAHSRPDAHLDGNTRPSHRDRGRGGYADANEHGDSKRYQYRGDRNANTVTYRGRRAGQRRCRRRSCHRRRCHGHRLRARRQPGDARHELGQRHGDRYRFYP
jgi:hypothetical protein